MKFYFFILLVLSNNIFSMLNIKIKIKKNIDRSSSLNSFEQFPQEIKEHILSYALHLVVKNDIESTLKNITVLANVCRKFRHYLNNPLCLKKLIQLQVHLSIRKNEIEVASTFAQKPYLQIKSIKVWLEQLKNEIILEEEFLSAVQRGQLEIVEQLIRRGVNLNTIRKFETKDTALIAAIRNNNNAMTEKLLAAQADVNIQNGSGATPLIAAVCMHNTSIAKQLLARGAKVNIKTKCGSTAVLFAICGGCPLEIVEALLRAKADITVKDSQGRSPLDHALTTTFKNQKIIKLLLEHGAQRKSQL